MISIFATVSALVAVTLFVAFVIVGVPSLAYMFFLWTRLERQLIDPKPFSFADSKMIFDPASDRYTIEGQAIIPAFIMYQRLGISCICGGMISGPLAFWLYNAGG